MEEAYRWNEYFAFASNLTTNLILVAVISAKSPPELTNYRRMLYLSCAFDLFLTIMGLAAMLQLMIKDGMLLYSVTSWTKALPPAYHYALAYLWVVALSMTFTFAPCQFYCRYRQICKNIPITRATMFRVLALMILLGCMDAFAVTLVFRFADFEGFLSGRPVLLREIGWRSEGYDLPGMFSGKPPIVLVASFLIYYLLSSSARYGALPWIGLKISRKLRSVTLLSQRTKAIHRQLNKTLTVQTLSPVLIGVVPMVLLVPICAFRGDLDAVAIVIEMSLTWVPTVNAVSTLLLVAPYRRAISRRLRITKPSASTFVSPPSLGSDRRRGPLKISNTVNPWTL